MNSSLFLLGVLAVKILPMEKGASSPFTEDLEFGSLGLCKGAVSTLLHIGLANLAVQPELRGFIGILTTEDTDFHGFKITPNRFKIPN